MRRLRSPERQKGDRRALLCGKPDHLHTEGRRSRRDRKTIFKGIEMILRRRVHIPTPSPPRGARGPGGSRLLGGSGGANPPRGHSIPREYGVQFDSLQKQCESLAQVLLTRA